MIRCRDGTSTTQVGSGTCSGHGGIDTTGSSVGGNRTPASADRVQPLPPPTEPDAVFRDSSGSPVVIDGATISCFEVYEVALFAPRPVDSGIDDVYLETCLPTKAASDSGETFTFDLSDATERDARPTVSSGVEATAESSDDDLSGFILPILVVAGVFLWYRRQ